MSGDYSGKDMAVGYLRLTFDLAAIFIPSLAACFWAQAVYVSLGAFIGLAVGIAVCLAAMISMYCRYQYSGSWLTVRVVAFSIALLFLLGGAQHRLAWQHNIGSFSEYDPWNGGCGRSDAVFRSTGGSVAVLRQVECTGAPIVPPSRDYFVFIHRPGDDHNDKNTLVLGYRAWAGDPGWRIEPTLAWAGNSLLRIRMGEPSFVTERRDALGNVKLTYTPGGMRISDSYHLAP